MRGLFRYPALGLLAAAIFGAGLSGCSSEVDVYVPVPVPEFENQVRLEVAWSSSVGSGVGRFYSALHPAFDGERVYAASRNGDVYAFDKKDGSRLWHLDLDDEDENDDRRSARISGGITVREDYYAKEWADAQLSADKLLEFRTKLLNVFAVNERTELSFINCFL